MSSAFVRRILFGLTALFFVTANCGIAEQRPIQTFQTANGLPRNTVGCLVNDPTGLVWLCTSEGLVSFDGYGFRVLGTENGLPARAVEDFIPSRSRGYWVITRRGVCRIRSTLTPANPCQLIPMERPVGDFTSQAFLEGDSGLIWIATTKGLWRLTHDEKKFERMDFGVLRKNRLENQEIRCLADYSDGWLLIGTDEGLYRWRPGAKPESLTDSLVVPTSTMVRVSAGEILIGMSNGLSRVTTVKGIHLEHLTLPGIQKVRGIVRRRDGTLWISSQAGVSCIQVFPNGKVLEVERITERDGLPAGEQTRLIEDHQGGLWGAVIGSGVYRIGNARITRYEALARYRIESIFEDNDHELCVRSANRGIDYFHVLKEGRFVPVNIRLPPGIVNAGWGWNEWGLQSRGGDWFIPTGSGLVRFPKTNHAESLTRLAGAEVLDARFQRPISTFRLFEDHAQDFWIATIAPNRLIYWNRKADRMTAYEGEYGSPSKELSTVIRQASNGDVWIGTYGGGVFRFRGDRFENVVPVSAASDRGIRDLLIDRAGRVLAATVRDGLLRCDNPESNHPVFVRYTSRDGLMTDSIRSLTEDDRGFIYAGTVRGVERIDPRLLDDGQQRIVHFTSIDGLPEAEQNVAFRDSGGHLWFGTLAGIAEFTPSEQERSPPPQAYITRVKVLGEDMPLPVNGALDLTLHLGESGNQVEIEYAGVDLRSARTLRYQYRLGGIDTQWSELNEQRSVNYARVPPGTFRFEVRAVNAELQSSLHPAAIRLEVDAPLWQRWWFVVSILAAIAAMVQAAYKYRVNRLLELERIRTRIATDLHDDIGATLSQISILSEVARRGSAPEILDDIANISRLAVQEMSDIVWSVSPRHDRLESLVHRMRRFAADTLGAADIELEFEVLHLPEDIDAALAIRRPLYLIFKEIVNNIARHSRARRATVSLQVDRGYFRIEIYDDGRGFDLTAQPNGEGRSNIARRTRDLGGHAVWDTALGAGTRFSAALPLQPPRSYRK